MSADDSPEQYRPLRIYSEIAFGVGWLIIGLGTIAALVGMVWAIRTNDPLGLDRLVLALIPVGVLLACGVIGLRLLAYSELIHVFIDIEENGRLTASRLSDVVDRWEGAADE